MKVLPVPKRNRHFYCMGFELFFVKHFPENRRESKESAGLLKNACHQSTIQRIQPNVVLDRLSDIGKQHEPVNGRLQKERKYQHDRAPDEERKDIGPFLFSEINQ